MKRKPGRPPVHDVMGFLREHPEHLDSTITAIAKAIGCSRVVVENQIALGVIRKTIKQVSVLRFIDEATKRTSKRSDQAVMVAAVQRKEERTAKLKAERIDEVRAYQAAYQREWSKKKKQ